MGIMDSKQMNGLSGEDQAKKAISHVLDRILDDKDIANRMGLGSQSFALLTEAAATLFDMPLKEVRQIYSGRVKS